MNFATHSEFHTIDDFHAELGFRMDGFQLEACQALFSGKNVLVCAPTGAGKTIVGQFAIFLALQSGAKCFYTTPIKALSNQKYDELVEKYGSETVGLLTGDSSINPQASVVVMTTEVLRNMLYARSSTMDRLSYVVMDEVHYLADRFRGGVWEEIILGLASHIKLVGLSATVSNAEEFGTWINATRGDTATIVDENRPVPLYQHMLVGSEIIPVYLDGRINPALVKAISRLEQSAIAQQRSPGGFVSRNTQGQRHSWGKNSDRGRAGGQRARRNKHYRSGSLPKSSQGGGIRSTSSAHDPRDSSVVRDSTVGVVLERPDIISELAEHGFLPVIYFIFSRTGCDQAVAACLRSSLVLNPKALRPQIDEIIEKHVHNIDEETLEVIGFYRWRDGLYRGFAAHHAGMLPVFRRAVEELYSLGLLQVVFATETLALGINMPARSVFVEKLTKYNGESHVNITAGEFTQLTGRAGRRGIDTEGHAVVCWRPGLSARQVATLASTRTFPLNSSFTPMYNMSLNLLENLGLEEAIELIGRSFAQYQADQKDSAPGAHNESDLDVLQQIAQCDAHIKEVLPIEPSQKSLEEYISLQEEIRTLERSREKARKQGKNTRIREVFAYLKPGHIIKLDVGKNKGFAVIVQKKGDKIVCTTAKKTCTEFWVDDCAKIPLFYGSIPENLQKKIRTSSGQKAINSWIIGRTTKLKAQGAIPLPVVFRVADMDIEEWDKKIAITKTMLKEHVLFPYMTDPEILPVISALFRKRRMYYFKLARKSEIAKANLHSLTRLFSRIILILTELGFITTDQKPELTDNGYILLKIYSESDLLVAQCLLNDSWINLREEELAAVVSTMVFESRDDRKMRVHQLRDVTPMTTYSIENTISTWENLVKTESSYNLKPIREPDLGFVMATYAWAQGQSLEECLFMAGDRGRPQAVGDFVRWMRQVIDLLEQISLASPDDELSRIAHSASQRLLRGIVVDGMAS